MKWLLSLVGVVGFSSIAHATVPLGGDNESGLEFPSSFSQCQYFSPDPTFAIQTGHARIIRLPYLTMCAVPTALGPVNAAYMGLVKTSITRATSNNVPVVLDLHDYGYVYGIDITTAQGEQDYLNVVHQVTLWLEANLTPQQMSLVIYGLMNEPHAQASNAAYQPVFQAAINQLRADGFTGLITYPSTDYSGAHDISVNSTFMAGVTDPAGPGLLLAEFHQYFDSNYSGVPDVPIASSTLGRQTLAGAEQWSARTGIKIILDETGDPQPAGNGMIATSFPAGAWTMSDQYFRQFMTEAANSGQYFAIIPWGGGQYWGAYLFNDYIYNNNFTPTGQTYASLAQQLGQ